MILLNNLNLMQKFIIKLIVITLLTAGIYAMLGNVIPSKMVLHKLLLATHFYRLHHLNSPSRIIHPQKRWKKIHPILHGLHRTQTFYLPNHHHHFCIHQ
jgi:hypothetical protein